MANNPFVFNTDGVRTIANQVTQKANQAQLDHESAWQRMKNHILSYPSNLQDRLFEVVNPHQQRMSQSYQWQLDYATALNDSANAVEEAETEMAQWFL